MGAECLESLPRRKSGDRLLGQFSDACPVHRILLPGSNLPVVATFVQFFIPAIAAVPAIPGSVPSKPSPPDCSTPWVTPSPQGLNPSDKT
jgi:hypothetical protein